jgi:uncharacterized protein
MTPTRTRETPFYFGGGDQALFGVLHEPTGQAARDAVVLCHAFAEEKLWAHRIFVEFARELAARGHAALRFDFSGNGDSDGEFAQSSLESNIGDLDRAIAELKAHLRRDHVTLLGLRLGAVAAAVAAHRRDDISRLILWNPIVDGRRYIQELLRVNIATQSAVYAHVSADREELVAQMRAGQTVNIDGYELGLSMYEQVSAIDLRRPHAFAGPCLIVQADRNPAARIPADVGEFGKHLARAEVCLVQEEPFWRETLQVCVRAERLFSTTLTWMDHI